MSSFGNPDLLVRKLGILGKRNACGKQRDGENPVGILLLVGGQGRQVAHLCNSVARRGC